MFVNIKSIFYTELSKVTTAVTDKMPIDGSTIMRKATLFPNFEHFRLVVLRIDNGTLFFL